MRVGVLGPLVVTGEDGSDLGVPTASGPRAVLELLALRAGAVVQAGGLAQALWGPDPPRSAAKTVQVYVSSLRRALPPGAIETIAGGYRLAVAASDVDASRFEQLAHDGHADLSGERFGAAAAGLGRALGLWRGTPLTELAGQPAGRAEVTRLEELRHGCGEDLAEARLALGEHAIMIADLETAVAAEPLRERRWAQLMLALYRCDRQADALAAFRRLGGGARAAAARSPSRDRHPGSSLACARGYACRPAGAPAIPRPGAKAPAVPNVSKSDAIASALAARLQRWLVPVEALGRVLTGQWSTQ
jgi:DNA-binding SARP family transcriptional activator